MSPAVVLAIVVATQNVDDQATESMRATAGEALGSEDAVVVREVDDTSDGETLRIERAVRAQAAAQVVWLDAAHTRARARVHVAETNEWTERTIVFAVVDTAIERGRALGFAVTSMLPEETLAANPYRGAKRPEEPKPELRTGIRLVGLGSNGLGGGYGGSIACEFFMTPMTALRLGVGFRQGDVPKLDGNDTAIYAAVGVAFWPRRPSPERRLAVGIRVDALALHYSVSDSRKEAISPPQSKTVPALDALAELALSVTPAVDLVLGLGIEAAVSGTQLHTYDIDPMTMVKTVQDAGTIPALHGVAEVGIRILF
jgi:hypothetical protein